MSFVLLDSFFYQKGGAVPTLIVGVTHCQDQQRHIFYPCIHCSGGCQHPRPEQLYRKNNKGSIY